MAITARLGSARPMFATLIATNEPRWRCPSQTPSGSASDERDGHGRAGQLQVLPGLLQDQRPLVDDELDRVREDAEVRGDHAVLRARAHGVSARWRRTSSPSATSASSTASPPATMISVLNASRSARKIG